MLVPNPFPVELWEEIAYSVDSSRDLLSLALVSRFFNSIVIPHHIQYRNICCDVRRSYLWTHLIDNRRRTKGIRHLELVDEPNHGTQLPPSLIEPEAFYTTNESLAVSLLAQSISFMAALEMFEWKYVPGGVANIADIFRSLVDKATRLRALSHNFEWPSNTEDDNVMDNLNSLPIWQLCNLTRVFLTYPCKSAQEMIIQRCPNLEDLYLYAPSHQSLCPLVLERGHWTKLRRLTLEGNLVFTPQNESSEEQETIATNFFHRQPNLQSLLLDIPSLSTSLFNFSLEMLRSISWTVSVSSTLSSLLSHSDLSRIVHYQTSTRDIDPLARMDSLETLQISVLPTSPPNLEYFFRNAPNLRKISLGGRAYSSSIKRLITFLIQYTQLTHVYLSDLFRPSELGELPRKLAKIKTLRYIQISVKQQDLFIEIDRNAVGGYSGYHFVPYSEFTIGQPPSEWGNFFFGL